MLLKDTVLIGILEGSVQSATLFGCFFFLLLALRLLVCCSSICAKISSDCKMASIVLLTICKEGGLLG